MERAGEEPDRLGREMKLRFDRGSDDCRQRAVGLTHREDRCERGDHHPKRWARGWRWLRHRLARSAVAESLHQAARLVDLEGARKGVDAGLDRIADAQVFPFADQFLLDADRLRAG